MATITFTAISPSTGEAVTRTSGTMPYVAAVFGVGVTWHKTFAAAYKAAKTGQHTWGNPAGGVVVEALPTAINGKISADFATGGWGDIAEATLAPLVAAKLGLVTA